MNCNTKYEIKLKNKQQVSFIMKYELKRQNYKTKNTKKKNIENKQRYTGRKHDTNYET